MKSFLLPATILLCLSCASAPEQRGPIIPVEISSGGDTIFSRPVGEAFGSDHWITRPQGTTITVIGIAGRRRQREESVAEALSDAARRVSLYHGVYGESSAVLNTGANNLDYFASTDYSLTIKNGAEGYLDALVFDKDADVYEKNGAVYVRTRYSGVSGIPAYTSVLDNGIPSWVKEYNADIPGFLAGIGSSKNRGSPQKTCQASYENAIVSLLPRLSSRIEGSVVDVDGSRRTANRSASSGSVSAVMILETWFDKKTGTVWTLLAAKAEE